MSNISAWSTTAASNDSASPNGFPEGMAPSGYNDSARELMASLRTWYEDVEWRNLGHTVTRTGNTTFTIPTDVTSTYVANRPIRCADSSTLYGYVASSSYGAPDTTVTVTLDSGNLSASLASVALGPTPSTQSIPVQAIRYQGTALLANSALWTGSPNFQGAVNYAATAGTDTYTATLSPALTAYTTGAHYYISFGNANATTTPTLNLNGLGAKTIVKDGSAALVAGDIPASHKAVLMYDGTNMVLLNPKNQAATAGQGSSLVYIGSGTASSSATLDFTTLSSSYDEFIVKLVNVTPATDNVDLYLRFSIDGGSTFEAGASDYKSGSTAATAITLAVTVSNDTGRAGVSGTIGIFGVHSTSKHKKVEAHTAYFVTSGDVASANINTAWATSSATLLNNNVDAIRFLFASGNIASGEIHLYGVKKA